MEQAGEIIKQRSEFVRKVLDRGGKLIGEGTPFEQKPIQDVLDAGGRLIPNPQATVQDVKKGVLLDTSDIEPGKKLELGMRLQIDETTTGEVAGENVRFDSLVRSIVGCDTDTQQIQALNSRLQENNTRLITAQRELNEETKYVPGKIFDNEKIKRLEQDVKIYSEQQRISQADLQALQQKIKEEKEAISNLQSGFDEEIIQQAQSKARQPAESFDVSPMSEHIIREEGGITTRTIQQMVVRAWKAYGWSTPIPDEIRNSLEQAIGRVTKPDGILDPSRVRFVALEAYKHGISLGIKTGEIALSDLPPIPDGTIMPEDIQKLDELHNEAYWALDRLKSKSTHTDGTERLSTRMHRTFSPEALDVIFRIETSSGNRYRVIGDDGHVLSKEATLDTVMDAYGYLSAKERTALRTHATELTFVGSNIVDLLYVPDKHVEGVGYTAVSIFDIPLVDKAFYDSHSCNRVLQALQPLSEENGFSYSFGYFAKILKTHKDKRLVKALQEAKKEIGKGTWENLRRELNGYLLPFFMRHQSITKNTEVISETDRIGLECVDFLNPVLAAGFNERGSRDIPHGYGSESKPLVIKSEKRYIITGPNGGGKSNLWQALISAGDMPVYTGRPGFTSEGYRSHTMSGFVRTYGKQPDQRGALLNRDEVPGQSTFMYEAEKLLSAAIQGGVVDEPGVGTSPDYQQAIAIGLALLGKNDLIVHDGRIVIEMLRALNPRRFSNTDFMLVDRYEPTSGYIATMSGGVNVFTATGLPYELCLSVSAAAEQEGVLTDLQLAKDVSAMLAECKIKNETFIRTDDLEKLGFHTKKGGILWLAAELLEERINQARLPWKELAQSEIAGIRRYYGDWMEYALEDPADFTRRHNLMKLFLESGKQKRTKDIHLTHTTFIHGLAEAYSGNGIIAAHVIRDLKYYPEIIQYIGQLQSTGGYEGRVQQFFQAVPDMMKEIEKLKNAPINTIADVMNNMSSDVQTKLIDTLNELSANNGAQQSDEQAVSLYEKASMKEIERVPDFRKLTNFCKFDFHLG